MTPPPPTSTLFPYTTLFRSNFSLRKRASYPITTPFRLTLEASIHLTTACETIVTFSNVNRSEEHTSELQSRGHLVCRLLLEKKKIQIAIMQVASWQQGACAT